VVLDPFAGSGTVGEVAVETGRAAVLIELKPEYLEFIKERVTAAVARKALPERVRKMRRRSVETAQPDLFDGRAA
jgi:DNA modification methylase